MFQIRSVKKVHLRDLWQLIQRSWAVLRGLKVQKSQVGPRGVDIVAEVTPHSFQTVHVRVFPVMSDEVAIRIAVAVEKHVLR